MAKLSSKSASRTHRIIIFGAPKTGKTQLAGELANHYSMLWVDMENGHETLFKLPPEAQERIELISLPDTRSYPIAIETVLKMVKGKVSICEEHGKVSCMMCKRAEAPAVEVDLASMGDNEIVVFDSLTQLTNSAIANITKNEADDYKLNYDDWGNLGKLLDTFLSHIQQAGYNVIVISHEAEVETEGKAKTLVPVGGTRNFSRNVAKYFDHVIYAEKKNGKHIFASSTGYRNNILTGSRTDVVMEEAKEGASLLAIFKPELFEKEKSAAVPAKVAPKITTSGSKAQAMLAGLKAKHKK